MTVYLRPRYLENKIFLNTGGQIDTEVIMSMGGCVGVVVSCLSTLINSIVDLGIEYKKSSSIRTADGKIHKVDLVVTDDSGKEIGFKKAETGEYNIISDCQDLTKTQLKKQSDFIKKIRQRYAYNTVMDKLKKEGYVIAEEEKVQNNSIRIVARKWS